jgi:membrane protein DedA with SNARE-associated domain
MLLSALRTGIFLQAESTPPVIGSALTEAISVLDGLLDSPYALLILLGIFVLEGAMLMYFIPSEGVVPAAILLMGGSLTQNVLIITIAVVGATAGQFVLFSLAKRGGREYLLEKRWFRISENRLDRFDGWFERWGPVVVPVSNSLLFTRGMLTVPAGFAEMRDRDFILLSALGTLSFETILALLTLGALQFGWF